MGIRRINVLHAPFNFYWPKVRAVTCIRQTGVVLVKNEVADAAVKAGYAVEIAPPTSPGRAKARDTAPLFG